MRTNSKYLQKIIFTAIIGLIVSTINISATTFTVANTNDSGAGSLRQAITDANAAAGDDIVAFDAGFNVPRTITLGGDPLLILGNGALTINGPGRNLLTVSANNLNRVFEVNSVATPTAANVVFNGLTITGGNTLSSSAGGAGIVINPGVSSPNVLEAVVTVNGVTITNNNAGNGAGGGINCARNGTVNVVNSIISNNRANIGGGINIGSGIGTCFLNVNGSEITRNTNQGLVCCGNAGSIDVQINIANSTFSYNFGGNGNGSAIRFGSNGFTTRRITNSTFFGNQGAAAIQVEFNNLILENVTIAGNYFDHPTTTAGLFLVGSVTATSRNSLFANNFNNSGGNDLVVQTNSTLTSQGYNLIENIGAGNGISGNTTGNQIGVDPLLDTILRDNGGLPPTLNLRPGSPAIDAGDPTTFPAADQRGTARPQDGDGNGNARSDIGAFEKRAVDIIPPDFDFDGDRRADISVFRPENGAWYLLQSAAGFVNVPFGVSTDKLVPADYDGDGKTDVAVFRNGIWYLLRSQSGFTGIQFGDGSDIPVPADYDGDGRADLAVFRPANGTWYLNRSQLGFVGVQFGQNGDKPAAADYDGDGRADLAVNRSGIWYLQRSTQGFTGVSFGDPNDKIVPADYDGDGKTDIAVFRPSSGTWYLLQSTAGFVGITFGLGTDIPAAADYDGDGRADLAVFRNGIWYLNRSTQGFTGIPFGTAADKPIPNAFVR